MTDNNQEPIRRSNFEEIFNINHDWPKILQRMNINKGNDQDTFEKLVYNRSYFYIAYLCVMILINISALIVGAIFVNSCERERNIPAVLMFMGAFGSLAKLTTMFINPLSKLFVATLFERTFYLGEAILFMSEMVFVYINVWPDFETVYSDKYCNPILYYYAFYYVSILSGLFAIWCTMLLITAIIVKPRFNISTTE